ncbi:hypothetical protein GCM10027535_34200 [Mycolicibacterium hippocampi]|uniref:Uncharacterized protein n=1 Tax=Mycolicibacterium hippocampi TaxID=659824 RepID=A0A7I9ZK15_9MYCO|nr:hypothetical protein MHIP_14610 [Mycolicibacterium hippocampi]
MDDALDPETDDLVRWELELLAHDLGLTRPEFDPDPSSTPRMPASVIAATTACHPAAEPLGLS